MFIAKAYEKKVEISTSLILKLRLRYVMEKSVVENVKDNRCVNILEDMYNKTKCSVLVDTELIKWFRV